MKNGARYVAMTALAVALSSCSHGRQASSPEVSIPETPSLQAQIRGMDDAMSRAFNAHDTDALMALFTPDVEFYHDTDGLQKYTDVDRGFRSLLSTNNGMRRSLIEGTLEVYPLRGYGALEVGAHQFCHEENGRTDCGTFRFLHVWRWQNGTWRIARVVSYGH